MVARSVKPLVQKKGKPAVKKGTVASNLNGEFFVIFGKGPTMKIVPITALLRHLPQVSVYQLKINKCFKPRRKVGFYCSAQPARLKTTATGPAIEKIEGFCKFIIVASKEIASTAAQIQQAALTQAANEAAGLERRKIGLTMVLIKVFSILIGF